MWKRKLDVTKRIHKWVLLALHHPFIHNSFRADWIIWATILIFILLLKKLIDNRSFHYLFCRLIDWTIVLYSFLKLDYDECGGNNNHCHQNAICTNIIGSYSCRCSVGYAGDGLLCRGIMFKAPSFSFSFNSWSIIIKGNSSNGKQTSLVSLRLATTLVKTSWDTGGNLAQRRTLLN